MDARHLQDGAGGTTGDDAGTGGGGLKHHASGPGLADDRMGDGGPGERHVEHVLARFLDPLLDGQTGFLGLAVAETDATVAVAHDHEGGEGETPATFHHLGHPVHPDGPLLELSVEHGQNSSPAERAASARAATRP